MISGFTLPLPSGCTLALAGFIGGFLTVFAAMGISLRFDPRLSNTSVILTGMVLSLFVNALLTLLTSFSGDHLKQLVFWQMGSFSGESWTSCAVLGIVLLAGFIFLCRFDREMDLMSFGEEQALSAGVELKKVKLLLIACASLLTGTAVAFTGVIGFVDLIVPHVARRLFGSRHRLLMPVSVLMGGGFMVLADLIGRTVVAPTELPVGAVTALVGAPFFVWVYFKRKGQRK